MQRMQTICIPSRATYISRQVTWRLDQWIIHHQWWDRSNAPISLQVDVSASVDVHGAASQGHVASWNLVWMSHVATWHDVPQHTPVLMTCCLGKAVSTSARTPFWAWLLWKVSPLPLALLPSSHDCSRGSSLGCPHLPKLLALQWFDKDISPHFSIWQYSKLTSPLQIISQIKKYFTLIGFFHLQLAAFPCFSRDTALVFSWKIMHPCTLYPYLSMK